MITSTLIGAMLYGIFAWAVIRNSTVQDVRRAMLARIELYCSLDAAQGYEWEWRIDQFMKVSHVKMVLMPWKKMSAHWTDQRFFDPHTKVIKTHTHA